MSRSLDIFICSQTSLTISRPILRSHELVTDFSRLLEKSNSKKLCSYRAHFQDRINTDLANSAVAFDYILLAYRDLPLPPNVYTYCFSCLKMAANKTGIEITKPKS